MKIALVRPERRKRADALRNRERLLQAAKTILGSEGPHASLEAVASAAGVGIGTLYRHFPERADLFEAVYRREVDQLVELAGQLAATEAPMPALRAWLKANVEFVATKRGLAAALALAAFGGDLKAYASSRLTEAAGLLMDRAVAAGAMRGDVRADELLRLLVSLCYGLETPDWKEQSLRLLTVFLDGLERVPAVAPAK